MFDFFEQPYTLIGAAVLVLFALRLPIRLGQSGGCGFLMLVVDAGYLVCGQNLNYLNFFEGGLLCAGKWFF